METNRRGFFSACVGAVCGAVGAAVKPEPKTIGEFRVKLTFDSSEVKRLKLALEHQTAKLLTRS